MSKTTTKPASAKAPKATKASATAKAAKQTKPAKGKGHKPEPAAVDPQTEAKVAALQQQVQAIREDAAKRIGELRAQIKALRPKGSGIKGPGVIAAIVTMLTAATEKKPISKPTMLDKLAEQFPDRDRDGLGKTLGCQVPGRIAKEKGLKVEKNDEGYWAVASGKAAK
jgi:hypothetical protein